MSSWRGRNNAITLWELWYLTWTGCWRKGERKAAAGRVSNRRKRKEWRLCNYSDSSAVFAMSNSFESHTQNESQKWQNHLADNDTRRYKDVHTMSVKDLVGHLWLICFLDKGQFVEYILHSKRAFRGFPQSKKVWGKELQNGKCPQWHFQNWKSWFYGMSQAFIWKCKLTDKKKETKMIRNKREKFKIYRRPASIQ